MRVASGRLSGTERTHHDPSPIDDVAHFVPSVSSGLSNVCRVRPFSDKEIREGMKPCVFMEGRATTLKLEPVTREKTSRCGLGWQGILFDAPVASIHSRRTSRVYIELGTVLEHMNDL